MLDFGSTALPHHLSSSFFLNLTVALAFSMRFALLAGALASVARAAPVANSTMMGTDLTNATIVSVPYNMTKTNTSTQITGNNPKDGTNVTLAAPFTPAGGDQQKAPTCDCLRNF